MGGIRYGTEQSMEENTLIFPDSPQSHSPLQLSSLLPLHSLSEF